MPTRRTLNGVVNGFLGKFTSRYSDYQGYWLFGFLVPKLITPELKLEINLLADNNERDTLEEIIAARASDTFADQLCKASFGPTCVHQARLIIRRLAGLRERTIDHRLRTGYLVKFEVIVIADTGAAIEKSELLFIAPHDPLLERRSGIFTVG